MKYFISFILLLTLSGCVSETYQEKSTINLVTTGDINNILQNKTTFAWHPKISANFLNKELNNRDIEQRFSQALKASLEQKGYLFTDDVSNADFYIGYGLGIEENIKDMAILEKTGLLTGIQPIGIDDNDDSQKASIFIALFLPNQPYQQWSVLAQGYTNTDNTYSVDEVTELMLHDLKEKQ
ncbi:DUF4136 domain-containing protein [Aliivibrio logei]|uniref:DUF4136 domain-containing protein n=1 Tax=Aliivibrio logei TaxID=688 RepID=A0A1B9P1X1_ALILO|nr:DUF4136 domain-containing protein [Aliivibrio logei]OCH22353.1 hypothetical protein A6E04_10970 [Aliivibrio logei]